MQSFTLSEPFDPIALSDLYQQMSASEITLIAMSGGVDSSVSALRAVQKYNGCIGITLLMQDAPHQVPAKEALERAISTCNQLKIPHITYDVSHSFTTQIVEAFAHSYSIGQTPNPCILCNPLIKFGKILEVSKALNAARLITGHYAHIVRDCQGKARLKRASSIAKDQSYFMYRVTPDLLDQVNFELGDAQSKDEVRQEARAFNLVSAQASDSMDVCFLEHENRLDLIGRLRPSALTPGPLVDKEGVVLGEHQGIGRVTIGQRKGLDYAGGKRLYVREIDAQTNSVQLAVHEDLMVKAVSVRSMVWHTALDPEVFYRVQLRYRSQPVRCRVETNSSSSSPDHVLIHLDNPCAAIASGQSAVLYDDNDLVVGGGFIDNVVYAHI